ncbi:MAG: DsbA family protein [Gemmatimonadetes bacterium]|nr:DsbA family protein [Gemmatimonadota bacterium]
MTALTATIFSDFTCPFCYVTEAALWRRADGGDLSVRYRALELYPHPSPAPSPRDEAGWREEIEPLAVELGLTLRAPDFRPRTRKAHEAACFAGVRGREQRLRRALFSAYWQREEDIGRIDTIVAIARDAGLDAEELKIALDIDTHSDEVQHDGEIARQLNLPGVPTLYLGLGPGARVLLGAQSLAAIDEAIAGR